MPDGIEIHLCRMSERQEVPSACKHRIGNTASEEKSFEMVTDGRTMDDGSLYIIRSVLRLRQVFYQPQFTVMMLKQTRMALGTAPVQMYFGAKNNFPGSP